VNSGNRVYSIAALICLGAFAATNAGRVGEDGTGAVWVAPELLELLETARLPGCTHDLVIEADLRNDGRVAFEWHPASGELSFANEGETPAVTLPEDSFPEPFAPAALHCGSR
jgi:hypothetical protein